MWQASRLIIEIKGTLVLEVFSETFPQKPFILIRHYLVLIKRLQVLKTVDAIFNLLEDGEWHGLTEIVDKFNMHKFKLGILTNFLAEYDFVELNKTKRRLRLTGSVVDFLSKIKYIEKDEG